MPAYAGAIREMKTVAGRAGVRGYQLFLYIIAGVHFILLCKIAWL